MGGLPFMGNSPFLYKVSRPPVGGRPTYTQKKEAPENRSFVLIF
jgi:hypothetical protein